MFLVGLLARAAMAAPAIARGVGAGINVLTKVGGAVAGGVAIADGVEKLKEYFGGKDKPSEGTYIDPSSYGTQPYIPPSRGYSTQPYSQPPQNQGKWGATISEVGKVVGMGGDLTQNPTLRAVGDGIKTVGSAVDYFSGLSNSNQAKSSRENDLQNMSDKDLEDLSRGLAAGSGGVGSADFYGKVLNEQARRIRGRQNGQQPYESYRGLDRVNSAPSPDAIAQQLAAMRARQDSIWNDQTTQREGASLQMIGR